MNKDKLIGIFAYVDKLEELSRALFNSSKAEILKVYLKRDILLLIADFVNK